MDLLKIEFSSRQDDDRVILEGRGLPFLYGRAEVEVHAGRMHITIKADPLTCRAMQAQEFNRRGLLVRIFDRIRGAR